jgi:superfamily II DNA/RNA helicase
MQLFTMGMTTTKERLPTMLRPTLPNKSKRILLIVVLSSAVIVPLAHSWVFAPPHQPPHHPFVSCKTTANTKTTLFSSRQNGNRKDTPSPKTASSADDDNIINLNELHTLFCQAAKQEDFDTASQLSTLMLQRLYGSNLSPDEQKRLRKTLSWKAGAAPWLVDRLDALNYTFPTTIQVTSMQAVQTLLSSSSTDDSAAESLSEMVQTSGKDMGLVISGATGSGKTLAYLVPCLTALSNSLFQRQRIRVGAEERVGDITGNLLDRVAMVTSPTVRSSARKQISQEKGAIATGAAIATLGESSNEDVTHPLSLIVVPTRELGVQTALLLFQLIGGNIKESPTESMGKANMFKFKGPKGVKIGCVLDDVEASFGLKLQTDIAITMPQYLHKLVQVGDIQPSMLRTIAFDEADLALEMVQQNSSSVLDQLFVENAQAREYSRLTFLVGASVTKELGNMAVSNRILPQGRSYIATSTSYAPLVVDILSDSGHLEQEATKAAALTDLDQCMNPGLKHERAIVKNSNNPLLILTRLLRKELQDYSDSLATDQPKQRPRVVIFFPDEETARSAIEPLRDALWGDHMLCVLLPKTGVRPLGIMEEFKQNKTSVMLATANSVRGLDFPALTHVYTLYLPLDDPREYIHLAGRVGRTLQAVGDGSHVVSIVAEEDAPKLDALAATLGFKVTDIETPPELVVDDTTDPDTLRRYLEDAITFSVLDKDADVQKYDSVRDVDTNDRFVVDEDDEETDDEEEDDDDEDDDE